MDNERHTVFREDVVRDWVPGRWMAGAVLAVMAVAALFLAHAASGTASYITGLVLFAFCVIGIFALISTLWGESIVTRVDLLPANGAVRWAVGGLVGVIAILGLLHAGAAGEGSAVYYQGLAIFAVAAALDFLLVKDWFDRQEHRPGG